MKPLHPDYAKNTTNLHPKAEAQKFIARLPTSAKIIDIGCGPGRDAKVFSGIVEDILLLHKKGIGQ